MVKCIQLFFVSFLTSFSLFIPQLQASSISDKICKIKQLTNIYVHHYQGGQDGGLAHITYWGLPAANPDYYEALPPEEKAKVAKINGNVLHAALFHPVNSTIAGTEITGLLTRGNRVQSITFRLPERWNGKLVVAGTPGLRNEYANEAILAPWLLEAGYGVISGNKGIPGGIADMVSGRHPTQHWGKMMIDMAILGQRCLKMLTGNKAERVYGVGLSNGGYQTRRALEIDHLRVQRGRGRIFDGGLDWSGAYWPDGRTMDGNRDGRVSVEEYGAADTLIGAIDQATLGMGWFYSPGTITVPEEYDKKPRFPGTYLPMVESGFSPESSLFWGYYNTNFDGFQYVPGLELWRGVGYYNLISYAYRADLLGDDAINAAAYSCFSDPTNPNSPPPVYQWLNQTEHGGWTREAVKYALKNSNSGEFSAPMLSLHGQHDGLLALDSQGIAYRKAVELFGRADLHRFYIIAHAGHVDKHADGGWGYSSVMVDPEVPDLLTPMQPYAQRAFAYLVDWVENAQLPPESKLVETDPANDILDSTTLHW